MNGESIEIAGVPINPGWHVSAGLTGDNILEAYSRMVLLRVLDERIWLLNRQGKVAIAASCQGHEAAQVASVWAMQESNNSFYFPYYRDLGVAVALGLTPREILLSFLARQGDPFSGSRQFPLHGAIPQYHLMNQSNVVAAHLTKAVGFALGLRMQGKPAVVIAYFGEGAASEGECHEAMNFAGIYKLPVIFMCENNGYAISVPQKRQMAIKNIADRALGYGFPGLVIDGMDFSQVYQATSEAIRRAKSGEGPTFVEAKVVRFMPHTSDDDDLRYRPKEELDEGKKRDPTLLLRQYLVDGGILTEGKDTTLWNDVRIEIDKAIEFAESQPFPNPDTLFDHLYAS